MRTVQFSPQAERDLNQIWEYIAAANIVAADRMVQRFFAAAARLAEMPRMGHRRRDVKSAGYLFWVVRPYLIAYRFDDQALTVVRVIHGARDVGRELDRPT